MKEIFVRRDFIGQYSGIKPEEAIDLVSNRGYGAVSFESDDRLITIVFWKLGDYFDEGLNNQRLLKELVDYFKYVESITGIETPEIEI